MMHPETPEFLLSLLNPEFFEGPDSRVPARGFRDIARAFLGHSWSEQVGGLWTEYRPASHKPQRQGWKIHVSTTVEAAEETLRRVIPVLARHRVSFKFLSDLLMVRMSLNKNWPRQQAGKFITVYPASESFASIIEDLYRVTTDLGGPHILTDRPYRDSKAVFYRYGEHVGFPTLTPAGHRVGRILSPDGQLILDRRAPYFELPPWVTDPFSREPLPRLPHDTGVLLRNRYRITGAIKFSNVGGVYRGVDTLTDMRVVVRESRPLHQSDDLGFNPQRTLEKEARVLSRLTPTGVVPRFVDFFEEETHLFLVQEFIEADSLWAEAMQAIFEQGTTRRAYFNSLRTLFAEIVDGLETVHSYGIVLRDLTKQNVLFTKDGKVKFIDMEFAFERDRSDPHVVGWTQGYASREQLRHEEPTLQEDHYALGALLLDMVAFTANGYELNRNGLLRALRITLDDLQLPLGIADIVEGLTHSRPARRWTPRQALRVMRELPAPHDNSVVRELHHRPPERNGPSPELTSLIQDVLDGILHFDACHCDYARVDRLWPAAPDAFRTNATQLQDGASGVAWFHDSVTGTVDERAADWITQKTRNSLCPPGFRSGLSGIALYLLHAGRIDDARTIMSAASESEVIHQEPSLYHGSAGWGLANLMFWIGTRDERYRRAAVDSGEHLLSVAQRERDGIAWSTDGHYHLGYGHGQAGIALFLLYLHAATRDCRFLEAAIGALDFEIANRVETANSILWFPFVGAPPGAPKSPHMRHGTAGVGTVVVRAYAATGERRFREFADLCAASTATRFTNKIWHDYGLAGFGEFLIDMYQFLGDPLYLNNAFYVAEGLIQHRIERPEGIAFLGANLVRMACDFGRGSAGIGLFLHRVLHPHTQRFLVPDELLQRAATTPPTPDASATPFLRSLAVAGAWT